jgi:tetratricopeptide (TPR) repeat protein
MIFKVLPRYTAVAFVLLSLLFSQVPDKKNAALEAFKQEHYSEAIILLEKALKDNPDDPEIYYYLGVFNHYRAYDSRPLRGYDYAYSSKIFDYLNKAIDMDPGYGNAKYFYGAECSANAFNAMQKKDLRKLKKYYKLAFNKGAYPDWLLEMGENILDDCSQDAILFAGGNADYDVCTYLQLYEKYRRDITLIPIGYIDRPWYISYLKQGLRGATRKIDLDLTDEQIMDIRPFKWDTSTVHIPLTDKQINTWGLPENSSFDWKLAPDLSSNRKHSKIAGESIKKRMYLSPQKAILLQIVEDNFNKRPICFSNMGNTFFFGGLDQFFLKGPLVSTLTPVLTTNRKSDIDLKKYEHLFQPENLKHLHDVNSHDIPRISNIVTNYHNAAYQLALYYKQNNERSKLVNLSEFYDKHLMIGLQPDRENMIGSVIKTFLTQ